MASERDNDKGSAEDHRHASTMLSEHDSDKGSAEDHRHESLDYHLESRWRDVERRRQKRVIARHESETTAMSWWDRMRIRLKGNMMRQCKPSLSEQYCVPPEQESLWNAFVERNERKGKRLASLSSFHFLLFHFLVYYFVAVLISALLLQAFQVVYYNNGQECITNYDYSHVSITDTDNFIVLFGLCWTTFSTVGYGVIGVSTEDGCHGMRYYLAVVAFVGVIYSGFSGSIIYSNLSGYLGRAHVTFSSSICLQYGEGVSGPRVTMRGTENERVFDDGGESIPGHFPVVQMRLVNQQPDRSSAIGDANLQCIAITSQDLDADAFASRNSLGIEYRLNNHVDTPEGKNGAKVTVCHEVEISPNHSPYFYDGAWYVEHVLDQNSPLLNDSVRRRIVENNNEWPSDLNEWSKIRASLSERVDYIALVLRGVSALTLNNIFETAHYKMSDIYVGYTFAELGYISSHKAKKFDDHRAIRFDTTLIHDIRPQSGGGNEPIIWSGRDCQALETDLIEGIDRRYLLRRGCRRNYDHLVRPSNQTMAMESAARRRVSLSTKLSCCLQIDSTSASDEPPVQYVIPPRDEKRTRWMTMVFPDRLVVRFTLWLYRMHLAVSLITFLIGYFVLIWIFALVVWAVDPECLSGWENVPGGFIASFYIPFQVSWTTFSTVGYGGVAPLAGMPCRGLSIILAGEAFLGVIYSSYCGAVFYAKLSRSRSFANVSFSHPLCIRYDPGGRSDAKSHETMMCSKRTPGRMEGVLSYPYMEMRAINQEAQYRIMKGEILNASIRLFASSFQLKPPSDDGISPEITVGDLPNTFSFDVITGTEWKRTVDELTLTPSHQVVLGRAPWYFRHTLDENSPVLVPSVRKRIKELGGWPSDLNTAEQIRLCISPHVHALHIFFEGTANNTAQNVVTVHEYKPKDIFLGWKFAGMAYVVEKKDGDETKCEVNFDLALFNDIIPQGKGEAEPIASLHDGH